MPHLRCWTCLARFAPLMPLSQSNGQRHEIATSRRRAALLAMTACAHTRN